MATMSIAHADSSSIEKHLSMNGGLGVYSYTQNSSLQAELLQFVDGILMQALNRLELPAAAAAQLGPLRIADIGCSVGPNTIIAVNSIVNKLKGRFLSESRGKVPEFQAFFVDLPANDFNTLFRMLPNYVGSSCDAANDSSKRSYFAAGVSGSFYNRLFPSKSLHVVFSCASLHWLSKIPTAVQDTRSPGWNKGSAWIYNANRDVRKAYAQQAHEDLVAFLNHRSCEMVSGGVLFALIGARQPSVENEADERDIADLWWYLFKEGLIDIATIDTFNVPIYIRSLDEIHQALRESGAFSIHVLEKKTLPKGVELIAGQEVEDPVAYGKRLAAFTRSWMGPLVEAHIGLELTDLLFQQVDRRVAAPDHVEHAKTLPLSVMIILSLVRN
ncbi:hypothetical protein O6H91_18G016200 [Diphasiastrum complanatum]|uniref:Uncharacterized protein n=1 Tax=Diphasiastrum complanatum TaxID=34168 RepID=A0ACC2AYH0_DIPCM|nr:hypothetical protein O6H91_18G016200 [Diphasiastrum complanatum]